jgi:uncharacterized membrane protein
MVPPSVALRGAILTLSALLPASVAAQNIGPHRVYGRYQQTVWQEQHGLPQNTVFAITRTRAGYLWLGTQDGAARFDGVQFTAYDATNTREIQGTIVFSALEDRAGVLWLATDNGGLTRYEHGRFTTLTTADGLLDNHPRSNKGFLSTNGTFTDIQVPGAVDTVPVAINNRGDIVGATYTSGGSRGFLLTKDGAFTSIAYPGAEFTSANGINASGEIVGSYSSDVSHGFVLSDGHLTTLDLPGAESTFLNGINSKGISWASTGCRSARRAASRSSSADWSRTACV